MAEELKSGYTTGSCAAIGVKAGLEALLNNNYLDEVNFTTSNGQNILVPIYRLRVRKNFVSVAVTKYAGDDPDVTNGIQICTRIKLVDELPEIDRGISFKNFILVGGRGVGTVTKLGLQAKVGKSAINPGPQKMIEEVADDFLGKKGKKAVITIYVPEGREKAKKTFNPKLGIVGGISILGSTGIVKPMSEEALKDSMFVELKVLRMARDRDWCIFTFGNYSKNYCEKLGLDLEQTIVISNYAGFMIDSAVKLGFKKILFLGHIGKAIKIAGGIFNTHSRVADARVEIMGANAFLCGESSENIHKILESNTVEEACDYIEKREFFPFIAEKVKRRVEEYSRGEIQCEVLLFSFKGETLGYTEKFYQLAGELAGKN
ncbi:cobalt-precorrin-5B (C(1))-methyltransferase CbiD [Fusobacterium sp.]|uniref:cobalt-precorrin-5B (C(1))-methyltransferase CbiD n=1 Tax=Fusobacterium sp. TaxID=68766 RepID=UPI0025C002A8|nr:cobalt-precorrin-5B (C(1))-methyltransferase CbiD [Fusobacterium sp.]